MKFTLAIPLCLAAFAVASVRPRGVESNSTAKSLAQPQHHENDAANAPASPLPKGGTRPVIMPPAVLAGDDDGDAGHHLHGASSLDINTTLLPSNETFPPASPPPPASNASIPILRTPSPAASPRRPPSSRRAAPRSPSSTAPSASCHTSPACAAGPPSPATPRPSSTRRAARSRTPGASA